jgi:hypothetical protein
MRSNGISAYHLITRKRSAQAVGSGVKERSSRKQVLSFALLLGGAQRLEGRLMLDGCNLPP